MPATLPVTFLFSRACPSNESGLELLERAAGAAGLELELIEHEVTSDAEAESLRFPGSPTYLVADADPFPPHEGALFRFDACRAYPRPDGAIRPLPALEALVEALASAAHLVGARR